MTCHDDRGRQVLDAALRCGLKVPDEVAVVSVDNDEHLCALSNPPLSSIAFNTEDLGYLTAKMLDRMMSGRQSVTGNLVAKPTRVITRRSTDIYAIEPDSQ